MVDEIKPDTIVYFTLDKTNDIIKYPDPDNWGHTEIVEDKILGDKIVGVYYGKMIIPLYEGVWPIPVAEKIEYIESVSNQEFMSLILHPNEFDRLRKYVLTDTAIEAIVDAFTRIQTRQLGNVVNSNLEYRALVQAVYDLDMIEPIPTEKERRDDLLKGFRLDGIF